MDVCWEVCACKVLLEARCSVVYRSVVAVVISISSRRSSPRQVELFLAPRYMFSSFLMMRLRLEHKSPPRASEWGRVVLAATQLPPLLSE
jgi:hypothetical protein